MPSLHGRRLWRNLKFLWKFLVPLLAQKYRVIVYDTMQFGNSLVGTPNVVFIKGDIQDIDKLSDAMKFCETVVHLAAIVTDELCAMNPEYAVKVNYDGSKNLVEACRVNGVKRLIYASSSGVYGSQRNGAFATEGIVPKPETVYMETKLAAEQYLREAAEKNGYEFAAVRSATCCGPAPRMRLDTVVNTFCKQAWFDNEIKVWGGSQWRSNIHVRDAAGFYQFLVDMDSAPFRGPMPIFNINRSVQQVLNIAQLVRALCPKSSNIVIENIVDTRDYRIESKYVWNRFKWCPLQSIETAIQENFAFFKAGGFDPTDDLYWNTRRMAETVKRGGPA